MLWLRTVLIVAGLAGLAISSRFWLRPLLKFLGAKADVIQALAALVQLLIWSVVAIVVVIFGAAHWWQRAEPVRLPASDDPSWITSLHQLPPPPADFTGREAELGELRQAIHKRGATIIGIWGMPGSGKTTLALKFAQELTPLYPDAQIILDLGGTSPKPLSAGDAMAHVIWGFQPEAKLPDEQAQLRALYCSVLEGKRVLLLMDNAAELEQVSPLVPPESCLLLVTGRRRFTLPGLYSLNLDVFPPEEARAFLLEICPRIGDEADRIAKLCGNLPLALRAAGSLLKVTGDLEPGEYARQLEEERTRLKRLGKEGVERDVEASFALSYNRASEEARRVFSRLSVFPGSFDAKAEEHVCQDKDHAYLTDLVRRSLVQFDEKSRRYRLHDLVRVFAASSAKAADRAAAEGRHAAHYLKVLAEADRLYLEGGEDVMRGLVLFDLERGNIEAGWQWAKSHAEADEAAARLCSAYPDAGAYVLDLRQYPRERIGWRKSAVAAARKLKDRAVEGRHLGNLGAAYAVLGETRRAIEFYQQRLEIAREVGDKRGEGNALGNLGLAYAALGETRRAIEFYEQTLAIAREIGDRRGEGNTLDNLGVAHKNLGETRRAIEYYEKALVIAREIGNKRGEGNVLGNLGNAYSGLGETRRAIEHYEKHLKIAREIGDKRGEASTLYNMADEYAKMGDHETAVPLAEAALAICEQIEDPNAEMVRRALETWRNER